MNNILTPNMDWNREQLIAYIKQNVIGDGTKKPKSPIDKYGFRTCGICDTWLWNTYGETIEDATTEELWQIITINNSYWLNKYCDRYHELQNSKRRK